MQKKGGSFLKENLSGMRLASKNTNPSLTRRQGEKPKKRRVEMKRQKSTSSAREFSNKRAFWRLILSVTAAM